MSLPSWECGLKSEDVSPPAKARIVAPFVGVWIEILNKIQRLLLIQLSLPSWECGLKLLRWIMHYLISTVAPFVGVWIEIDVVASV